MYSNIIDSIVKEVVSELLKEGSAGVAAAGTHEGCGGCKCNEEYDKKLAAAMEHSMIRPDATPAMVKQFCEEAARYGFRNVALAPCFVPMASQLLKGTGVRVSTAVAFPMGIASTSIKAAETREVIENGATEIDLPINVGMLKSGELKAVKEDIEAVVQAAAGKAVVKVVVDLGQLTDEEKVKAVVIAKMAGATFLKVAAGSKPGGVTVEDMKFIRQAAGPEMGLKADGGIKDYQSALAVMEAGATTIGASGSVKIVKKG